MAQVFTSRPRQPFPYHYTTNISGGDRRGPGLTRGRRRIHWVRRVSRRSAWGIRLSCRGERRWIRHLLEAKPCDRSRDCVPDIAFTLKRHLIQYNTYVYVFDTGDRFSPLMYGFLMQQDMICIQSLTDII